jgi:hypothetical protein
VGFFALTFEKSKVQNAISMSGFAYEPSSSFCLKAYSSEGEVTTSGSSCPFTPEDCSACGVSFSSAIDVGNVWYEESTLTCTIAFRGTYGDGLEFVGDALSNLGVPVKRKTTGSCFVY